MSGSINKVTLIGNVGKDPEIRSFQNGNRVATFSIATSTSWKDKDTGEKKEVVQWHNIAVFNDALVGNIEKYVTKGMKLYVEGQLETRKWEKDGETHYATEVVLRQYNGTIVFLSKSGEDTGTNNGGQSHQNRAKSAPKQQGGFGAPSNEAMMDDDLNDSIPF